LSQHPPHRTDAEFDGSATDAANPPSTAGAPDLRTLLTTGPFPDALRAAIRARGLSLARIQARLAESGTPVSLATLSHWQSGRSQPERDASLTALGSLEALLGLPPRALAALLGPPRRRGRKRGSDLIDLVNVYQDKSAVLAALRDFDTVWGREVTLLSHHGRVVVGADGCIRSVWDRRVLRASADGPDHMLVLYDTEGCDPPVITPLRGCSLGRVVTDHAAGLVVAELLFGHPLRHGEFLVTEIRLDLAAQFPPDTSCTWRVAHPLREYVLEVDFAQERRPERCVQLLSPAVDSDDFTERVVHLDEFGCASVVALGLGPCQFGLRWEWGPSAEPPTPVSE
jgi:hypothetical protein